MTTDRPFYGILLMLGFCLLAPIGDSIAKILGGTVSLAVILMARFSVQAIGLYPVARYSGLGLRPAAGTAGLIWLRTVLQVLGLALMYLSLQFLPLADALAIAFVMPFIMLILGHFVLGEEVGKHRIGACVVGFIGTLLVIQPNFAEVGAPALLPLGVAVVFSLFMLTTRQVAKSLDPIALQVISGLQATLILIPVLILTTGLTDIMSISGKNLWLLLALGVMGSLAHLMMTWSLRLAPASTLAPMQYLEIPIGTMLGYLVFKDLPNGLAALGICITIAAGLYIVGRERRLSQRPTDPSQG